jgi:hypothetical protein
MIQTMLFAVSPFDPITMAAVAMLLIACAVAARAPRRQG